REPDALPGGSAGDPLSTGFPDTAPNVQSSSFLLEQGFALLASQASDRPDVSLFVDPIDLFSNEQKRVHSYTKSAGVFRRSYSALRDSSRKSPVAGVRPGEQLALRDGYFSSNSLLGRVRQRYSTRTSNS